MLEDRDYMRQPEFGENSWGPRFALTWTTTLVAVYVVVLLAELSVERFFPGNASFLWNYFALSTGGLARGYVWQLLTYQFMHAGWIHLILNSWALIVFGSALEQMLGARRYLTVLFLSGIAGGVFQVLLGMVWPAYFGGAVVGASAGVFGLVAAFAALVPNQELTMLIFFVIPVRMRAKTLLILSFVIALMGIIFPMGNIANAAHLGGMAMGWFYVKKIIGNPALMGTVESKPLFRFRSRSPVAKPAEELDESDVDAVLDKISARGINSLTSKERAILEAARKRMARR
jgi:membrane associated rhomboid family serine protease